MTYHPIVTFSGRVHYRDEDEPTQWDVWDRHRARPMYAAACNPNTIGRPPVRSPQGKLIAVEGVKKGELFTDLPTCKRCAKKTEAAS